MKIVFVQNVDGYEVVRGFCEAALDPVGTAARIADDMATCPEEIARAQKHAQIESAYEGVRKAAQAAANAYVAGDQATNLAKSKEAADFQSQGEALAAELPALNAALEQKRAALSAEKGVYFTPAQGEFLCTEEQVAAWKALEAAGSVVTMDGKQILDKRGVVYWIKGATWASVMIRKLGEDIAAGGILDGDLSDTQKAEIASQIEAARVSDLPDAAKLAEASAAQRTAKAAVVSVQAEVSAGISDQAALDEALAVYRTRLAEINAKYSLALK
jgi:hypothetical protein